MANHCIDVICLDCGDNWCARGCNNKPAGKPCPEALKRREDHRQWWEKQWEKKLPDTMADGEVCPCGSRRVAHD